LRIALSFAGIVFWTLIEAPSVAAAFAGVPKLPCTMAAEGRNWGSVQG
jgi:hypothetical protein